MPMLRFEFVCYSVIAAGPAKEVVPINGGRNRRFEYPHILRNRRSPLVELQITGAGHVDTGQSQKFPPKWELQ
jgi:hypothetical protein